MPDDHDVIDACPERGRAEWQPPRLERLGAAATQSGAHPNTGEFTTSTSGSSYFPAS